MHARPTSVDDFRHAGLFGGLRGDGLAAIKAIYDGQAVSQLPE